MHLFVVFVLGIFFNGSSAASLPKYIKLCSRSDSEFDKCALRSGKEAIKHLIDGEKSLKILPLSPLKLPFVQLENTENFQLNMTDVEVLGLDRAELVDVHVDLDKHEVKIVVHLEEIELKGQFHAEGRVLILPIKGDGPGTVKAYAGDYMFSFRYNLVNKGGVEYAKIDKNDFSFNVKKVEFAVEQVFGENTTLGAETNKFLNENWIEVIRDFEQVIGQTIGSICNQIASGIFENVPYNQITLP
ncbi:takeout [Asbolus verrucosus]|uniref:Takeout n=1 Tax=Asbolus verrucosus TaxID=1661398 RepID=A0A482WCK3_ASBVE|nr:takeout [Asbolus verrucosus]